VSDRLELWWLPVGAGSRIVPHTSRWWERWSAWRERRPARPLFHAALEVHVRGERTLVEMAPAWGGLPPERGVVLTGPVGMRWLGRSRWFRYEVRRWRNGVLPDRAFAVDSPVVLQVSDATTRGLLARVADVPTRTWGRDELGVGDMWNSNSLVSWLLQGAGIDAASIVPPLGGRAPGWAAGIAGMQIAGQRG
jgi:hypothetical protein